VPVTVADEIVEHCKRQRESLEQLIELLEAGAMMVGENHGDGWVDTTADSLATNKRLLAEVKRIEELALQESSSG
jgi:L-rhamnose isomerase